MVSLPDLLRVLRENLPGVVQSVMLISKVLDGSVSGVVIDPAEPGGGYVSEQELAHNATYLVLGVDIQTDAVGVMVLDDWADVSK